MGAGWEEMKRQQAISRFFAPKSASSSGTPSKSTPNTSSHANRRRLETPPSVIGSPRALAPGGASKSIVQGFAFSPAAKKRRASEEEETEPSQDVLGSGSLKFLKQFTFSGTQFRSFCVKCITSPFCPSRSYSMSLIFAWSV